MKPEFRAYLTDIGASSVLIDRANEILAFYEKVHSPEIDDLFVSEFVTNEEERQWESLFLFSKGFILEAHDFMIKDDFDIAKIDKILHVRVEKLNYDFEQASRDSRMKVYSLFSFFSEAGVAIRASGRNCDYLKKIITKYLVPKDIM